MRYILVSLREDGDHKVGFSKSISNYYSFEAKADGTVYVVGVPELTSEEPFVRPVTEWESDYLKQLDRSKHTDLSLVFNRIRKKKVDKAS